MENSIYSKLLPKYRNELDAQAVKYQNSYGKLKSELMSTEHIINVSYESFHNLNTMSPDLKMTTSFYNMIDNKKIKQ